MVHEQCHLRVSDSFRHSKPPAPMSETTLPLTMRPHETPWYLTTSPRQTWRFGWSLGFDKATPRRNIDVPRCVWILLGGRKIKELGNGVVHEPAGLEASRVRGASFVRVLTCADTEKHAVRAGRPFILIATHTQRLPSSWVRPQPDSNPRQLGPTH